MADDENETDVPVIVGDVDTAPDEVTNEGDTVVIVETPADDGTDADEIAPVVIDTALDHEGRISRLEVLLDQVAATANVAEVTAGIALDEAEAALEADEQIIAATDDAIVETLEGAEIEDVDKDGNDEIVIDEIAPVSQRVHWMFRSRDDWRNSRK